MSIIKKSQQKKIAANEQNNEQQNEQDSKKKKSHRLSIWEISEFMIENNIKSETELFTIADELRQGKKILQSLFCLTR